MKPSRNYFIFLSLALLCCQHTATANETIPSIGAEEHASAKATRDFWDIGQQSLINSEQASRSLATQVEAFLSAPNDSSLAQVQQEWRNSHQQWQQHSLWPLLASKNGKQFAELKQRYFEIEARDLEPGYLDAVQDYPHSGIVNDISIPLNSESLRHQHGLTDNSEVSLGFHAMELLLWGDQGQRKFNDYQVVTSLDDEQIAAGFMLTDLSNNRRRQLLRLTSQLLADDIQRLRQDWQNPQSSVSQSYLSLAPETRLEWLQQATRQLLGTELPQQVSKVTSQKKHEQHNQFAGDTFHLPLATLAGLEQLLMTGQQPLLHWLVEPKQTGEWQQNLRLLIAALSEAANENSLVAVDKISRIQNQLQQLASVFENGAKNLARD